LCARLADRFQPAGVRVYLMVRRNNTGPDQRARGKLMYCFLTMQSVRFSCTI
jgi:hypothetical protein